MLGHHVAELVLGDRVDRAIGHRGLIEDEDEVGRTRGRSADDRLLVALAGLDRDRMEQRAVPLASRSSTTRPNEEHFDVDGLGRLG